MKRKMRNTNYSISLDTLKDETLVDLFRDVSQKKEGEKNIARLILKTLLKRKKLFLLTKGR